MSSPEPVERDSRGILDPWLLQQRVNLSRYPVGPALGGLIDRFWAVEWDLPAGTEHRQAVLTHPGCNLSVGHADAAAGQVAVGPLEARLNGVARTLTTRRLVGRGWAVAAMTTPGGVGAFITEPASNLTDRVVPLGSAVGLDDTNLIAAISSQPHQKGRVDVLARILEDLIVGADPERVHRARHVAEVARLAETDRSLRRLSDVCARSGVGPRKLQRMFLECAGVSPTWVLRRYRLLDAAEAVRDGQVVSWAGVAGDLGYADQAHLSRDFHAAMGTPPAAYAASLSAP
ncbi:MAG: helix-turn-helix domain-containing protein [Actinomycetota bacterium]|nr:helix-turn-helix domain-containing protein [Actinomycetota bacterium]